MITSRDNAKIKQFRRLSAEARFRRQSGCCAIEGARICADAAVSGATLFSFFYTAAARERYPEKWETVAATAAETADISEDIARFMGETTAPQGFFCIARTIDNPLSWDKIEKHGRFMALEDVQDPGNLGTIIRTAEAMGASGLLLSAGCCDLYNPKVLRGSMGGVFRLPVFAVEDMVAALGVWRAEGFACYACVVDPAAVPIRSVPFADGTICVIGNEGNGLCSETAAACSERLTIPMAGRAESLNASMAAGIVLWEMMR